MLYEFKGYDGQIELYENKIVIKRKGSARFTRGFALGEKEIFLKSISGIQVKKPGMQAGYIQFIFSGSKEIKKKNIMDVAKDENTVMFQGGNQKYQEALELKRRIESLMNQPMEVQTVSKADELLKYKQLLDSGAITEDEFNNEKNRLLSSNIVSQDSMSFHQQTTEVNRPYNNGWKQSVPANSAISLNHTNKHSGKRNGMQAFAIVLLVLAAIYFLMTFANPSDSLSENDISETNSELMSEEQTAMSTESTEIELTREEKEFVEAFGCNAEQAKQMYSIFEEIGLTLSNADKVSRREDLDNWDDDGSIAYEIADVIKVDGEQQCAYLYLINDFEVSDIRFLSCYLYEDGAFVQTAEEAVSVGWAASLFENECPIGVSATMTTDLIGTPVVEANITNNSDKNIAAVKILAHPLDVYSAPIQNYGYGEEYTSLNSDESISAGGSKTVSWSLYGYDTTKTVDLWVYSVYFEDGTQWGAYDGLSLEIMQKYGVYLTAE